MRYRDWWLAGGLLALLLVIGPVVLWVRTPALYGTGDDAKIATATTRAAILTVAAALIAATAAGVALAETQWANRASEERTLRAERREAFVAFLASVRQYRRFLMYSDVPFEVVDPTPQSKGTVLFKGRDRYDAEIDKTYTRLLVVTESVDILTAADSLPDRLNDFVRERAKHGKGNIPNESVGSFLNAERECRTCEVCRAGTDLLADPHGASEPLIAIEDTRDLPAASRKPTFMKAPATTSAVLADQRSSALIGSRPSDGFHGRQPAVARTPGVGKQQAAAGRSSTAKS